MTSASTQLLELQHKQHLELKESFGKNEYLNFFSPKKEAEGRETIDLNYRLVCKDCQKVPPNIVENYKAGDYVCGDCGLVFPMRIIDAHSEWRNFADSGGDDPSRVGASENPLLEGVVDQLSTNISSLDNRTGQSMALQKTQTRSSGAVKGDRDLMQAFRDIAILCDNIGLPKTVADFGKQLYKLVFDKDIGKGKANQGLIAACILLACRHENVPRTFKEICSLTKVDKRTLGRCYKTIVPLIEKKQYASTEDYVARFCSHLGISNDSGVQNLAAGIVKNATRLGILAGKSPLSVASSAIYMACQVLKVDKTEREISPVAGISEITIRSAYRELWIAKDDVMPKDVKY